MSGVTAANHQTEDARIRTFHRTQTTCALDVNSAHGHCCIICYRASLASCPTVLGLSVLTSSQAAPLFWRRLRLPQALGRRTSCRSWSSRVVFCLSRSTSRSLTRRLSSSALCRSASRSLRAHASTTQPKRWSEAAAVSPARSASTPRTQSEAQQACTIHHHRYLVPNLVPKTLNATNGVCAAANSRYLSVAVVFPDFASWFRWLTSLDTETSAWNQNQQQSV